MYRCLVGTRVEFAGTAGTVTIPSGAFITHIMVHASTGGATMQILGGTAIPIINGAQPLVINYYDDLEQANASSSTVVFTNTDQYWVRAVKPGHT